MIVAVTGGRNFADKDTVERTLSQINISRLVHGGCRGADKLAADWAKANAVPTTTFNAAWNLYGAAAGPRRNREMVNSGIDLLVAFPGGRGTTNCVTEAIDAGISVMQVGAAQCNQAADLMEG